MNRVKIMLLTLLAAGCAWRGGTTTGQQSDSAAVAVNHRSAGTNVEEAFSEEELAFSASKPATHPVTVQLTWRGYDAENPVPESTIYLLGSKEIGKGSKGFKSVLKELATLPRGSSVLIYPERAVRKIGVGGESGIFMPETAPFAQSPDELAALTSLANQHGIELWYLAARPRHDGTGDGREDFKVYGNHCGCAPHR